MNLFYLHSDPILAAQMQCDKHIVKMIVESGQMLSTCHRLLDGTEDMRPSSTGKTVRKYWELPDDREDILYKACFMNHPCTVWTRESSANYEWHYEHWVALLDEYTFRYGKHHKAEEMRDILGYLPDNIPHGPETPVALAMGNEPQCINEENRVQSYRDYYMTKQGRFDMVWSKRPEPEWFIRS